MDTILKLFGKKDPEPEPEPQSPIVLALASVMELVPELPSMLEALRYGGIGMTIFMPCVMIGILLLLRRWSSKLGIAPPTTAMKAEEKLDNYALFRHFPALKETLANSPIGRISKK